MQNYVLLASLLATVGATNMMAREVIFRVRLKDLKSRDLKFPLYPFHSTTSTSSSSTFRLTVST